MGIFQKLFSKKQEPQESGESTQPKIGIYQGDTIVSLGDELNFKVVKSLSQDQKDRLNASTIPILLTQLYMHYWSDGLVCDDPQDQAWKNQAVFFWKAEEPFPRKSLPVEFETLGVRYFIFVESKDEIVLKGGQVVPWFGMPGLGTKYYCEMDNQAVPIAELCKLGVMEYIETAELTPDNLDILTDREQYFYLADEKVAQVKENTFYLHGKPIPIDVAYSIGGVNIVRKVAFR